MPQRSLFPSSPASLARRLLAGAAALAAATLSACESGPPPKPKAESRPIVERDLPQVLRGTIGSEAEIRGSEPVLVTGYGVVIGLNGTGSGEAPIAVRSALEREMALRGVGQESLGMGGVSPKSMLDDPNNCIVLVTALLSPGAPKGSKFDVFVSTLPGSPASSLEGGRLWTTELRIGLNAPGGPQARAVAKASGTLFVNPFADPAKGPTDAVSRTTARILRGGEVSNPLELLLILDNPSHARARAVTAAINTRFPQGSADRTAIAKGRNEESIAVTVPDRYKDRPDEFLQLLKYTRVDQTFPEEWSVRYIRAMQEEPWIATELSWCLQALGAVAVPQVRTLYESADITPRLAALRAGARLGDALVIPHLKEIARSGPSKQRLSAIELLGEMGPDPQINNTLFELLDDDEPPARIAAYESLVKRADPRLERRRIGDKFTLDVLPAKRPLIYVSQQGAPRIAVFGKTLEVSRPAFVSAWDDRLMLSAENSSSDLRVLYRSHRSGEQTIVQADHRVSRFIEFLAHDPTPESPAPGLSMSYTEVVAALYELTERSKAIPAGFLAEQDKLVAELLASAQTEIVAPRPELIGDEPVKVEQVRSPGGEPAPEHPPVPPSPPAQRPSLVVPIPRAPKDKKEQPAPAGGG